MSRIEARFVFAPSLLAVLTLVVPSACRSSSAPATPAQLSAEVKPVGPQTSFQSARNLDELHALARADIESAKFEHLFAELEALTRRCQVEEQEAWGYAAFRRIRPVIVFQQSGHTQRIHSLKELEAMLADGANREVDRGYTAFRLHRMDDLRKAAASDRSFMAADVRVHLEKRSRADFVAAMLDFDHFLGTESQQQRSDAPGLAARLDELALALQRDNCREEALLTQIAAAQALDQTGFVELALERWLVIGNSSALLSAEEALRLAVAGKILSFRERVRAEVLERVQGEERERADREVQRIQREREAAVGVERQRADRLEAELATLAASYAEERDNREEFSRWNTEQLHAHLAQLAGAFAGIAGNDDRVATPASSLDGVQRGLTNAANLVTCIDFVLNRRARR